MKTQPLQPTTPVTQVGDLPSGDMVLIMQQLHRAIADLQRRVEALEP